MTNVEARRNDRIRIISTPGSRLRHSGFDIPSSFVIRASSFRAEGAVTIIELLVVMMIIFILAALILATSSYVQNKGARSRAETEIAAMSGALESYKADNGIYPFTAQTNSLTSATTDPASYKTASLDFYKLISGDGDANGATDTGQKSYFTFKPQMLGGTRDANGNITAVQYVRDPFGNSYGYSTSKNPMANPTGYASAVGNNPTFDLWSTGGSVTSDTSKWIKNW
jgi:type II secretory pathway pseudopilin PulG